jgi:hypothetical protein
MSTDPDFKPICSAAFKEGGSAQISFPVPKGKEPIALSMNHERCGIEYYLLARYAFLHRMHFTFMMNSFWAVEHLLLSLLVFKFKTKDELFENLEPHAITKYWALLKSLVREEGSSVMGRFDGYVGRVRGYFDERYPKPTPGRGKLTHTSKKPPTVKGSDESGPAQRFGKVAPLSLGDLDHFVNFMLHDVTFSAKNGSTNLHKLLASHENLDLYAQDNDYSILFPNKKYFGEGGA